MKRHLLVLSWALAMLVLLSGCVFLRLLEVKGQLADFDKNFKVEARDGFTLHFLHPVLYRDDLRELSKMEASRLEPKGNGIRWVQVLHKLNAQGQVETGKDMVFTWDFNADDKLTQWDFPPIFMAMVPAPFMEASIRSLGKGKINQGKKQLHVDQEDLPKIYSKPPNLAQITAALGAPAEETKAEHMKVLIYRFKVETTKVEKDYENRLESDAKLFFDPATGELVKMKGRFIGLKMTVDLHNLIQLQENTPDRN